MGRPGDPSFDERRKAAADSKAELLNKFRASPAADDPAVQARRAEREAAAAARDARSSERDRQKREEASRLAATELAAAAAAERETEVTPGTSEAAPMSETEVQARKAERDRRYAARKARKR